MPRDTKFFGYVRVSSKDQNLDRQLDALLKFGVSKNAIYADKASGKDFTRPAYRRLVRRLGEGDVLVVMSIDRLGRNYDEVLEEWRRITKEKKAAIVVLDMPLLDTRETHENVTGKFIADLVLQLLSYVAQIEREHIRKRQAEGIAAAKARGVRFGRPTIKRPKNYAKVKNAYLKGEITRKVASTKLSISTTTFDSWLRQDNQQDNDERAIKNAKGLDARS